MNVLAWIIIIGFLISPILDIILVKKLIWYRDELSSVTDDLSSLSLKYNNLNNKLETENEILKDKIATLEAENNYLQGFEHYFDNVENNKL